MAHETKEIVTPQEWSYVTLPYRGKRRERQREREPGRAPVTKYEQSQSTPARVCMLFLWHWLDIHFTSIGIKKGLLNNMDTFIFRQLARKIIQFTTGYYLEVNIK